MTQTQYLNALKRLGLTVASKQTAAALGLSVRHAWNLSQGRAPVPGPVALLLKMYLLHGIPEDLLR